ncbi:MAG: SDR family oxidoreductase [Pseudomonadales bacterium]
MTESLQKDQKMPLVLVQGASRGIGLAFVRTLIKRDPQSRVIATCRAPDSSDELQSLAASYPERVVIKRLDVTEVDSIALTSEYVQQHEGALDVLINSAGILHDADGLSPEKRLQDVSAEKLEKYFWVNSIGPLLVAKYFAPLMKRRERAVIANLSARVGSIGDNRLGGWYGYRASKSAQNMFTRTLSIEMARTHPEMICVGLHPGTVATSLSQRFSSRINPEQIFSPALAAEQLLAVIDGLTPSDSGKVFAYDGSVVPW